MSKRARRWLTRTRAALLSGVVLTFVGDVWSIPGAWDMPKSWAALQRGIQLTVLGLDSAGRGLNAASAETRSYSVGGLPESTAFTLALWNAAGDGKSSVSGSVTSNASGVARFEVPLHAAFSLTTVPVS